MSRLLFDAFDVTLASAVSLTIAPTSFRTDVGESFGLVAVATLSDASRVDASALATWTSSDPTIAAVDSVGRVVAVAYGSVVITAAYESCVAVTACLVGVAQPVVGVDVPDLVAQALSRLLEQDKRKPLIAELVAALVSPFQDVVNAAWQLATQRSIYTAIGAQLDGLGVLLDVDRAGADDDPYRETLLTRIAVLHSDGTTETLIGIATLALDDPDAVVISTSANAVSPADAFAEIRVAGIALDDVSGARLFGFLAAAVKSGVRLIVRWSTVPAAQTFTLDAGPGLDAGRLASAMEG